MATIKIEPTEGNKLWVTLTCFGNAELARLKKIADVRWNPERKQWQLLDTPETRKALAEIVAMPPSPPSPMLAVKPKKEQRTRTTCAPTLRCLQTPAADNTSAAPIHQASRR